MQDLQHPVQKYSFIKFHETIKKKKKTVNTIYCYVCLFSMEAEGREAPL